MEGSAVEVTCAMVIIIREPLKIKKPAVKQSKITLLCVSKLGMPTNGKTDNNVSTANTGKRPILSLNLPIKGEQTADNKPPTTYTNGTVLL